MQVWLPMADNFLNLRLLALVVGRIIRDEIFLNNNDLHGASKDLAEQGVPKVKINKKDL